MCARSYFGVVVRCWHAGVAPLAGECRVAPNLRRRRWVAQEQVSVGSESTLFMSISIEGPLDIPVLDEGVERSQICAKSGTNGETLGSSFLR